MSFTNDILHWYDVHKRDLPWRQTYPNSYNPYHVLASEFMLQQTTIETVLPYFHRLIQKWPTIKDLAEASEDDIMTFWSGLGYYRRARNLLRCAKAVMSDFGGQIPYDKASLLLLPGVGDYTASAISAIAFNRSVSVVDGNVKRVFARQTAFMEPIQNHDVVKEWLDPILSDDRSSCFTQSLMDLGSQICKPSKPLCNKCPVAHHCKGYESLDFDQLQSLPKRIIKTKKKQAMHAYFVSDGDSFIMRTRPLEGLLAGMIELPSTKWHESSIKNDIAKEHQDWMQYFCCHSLIEKDQSILKHVFTHIELSMHLYVFYTKDVKSLSEDLSQQNPGIDYRICSLRDMQKYALPTMTKKLVRKGMDQI